MSVYSEAAELIHREGWCQGRSHDLRTGRYCLYGALRQVLDGSPYAGPSDDTLAARDQLRKLLGGANLSGWNDEQARTVDDVLALLDEAHRQETAE